MKKTLLIVITVALMSIVVLAMSHYWNINKDKLMHEFMLYDHIQYNGIDYYLAIDQHNSPSNVGEVRGPVYLVSKSMKVSYDYPLDAYVFIDYEGSVHEIFLFFDSAIYIRGDYLEMYP